MMYHIMFKNIKQPAIHLVKCVIKQGLFKADITTRIALIQSLIWLYKKICTHLDIIMLVLIK